MFCECGLALDQTWVVNVFIKTKKNYICPKFVSVFQTLKQLRHNNLVNLLEVWKRRHRWYLVFEFVDRTLLNDLEQNPNGLDLNTCRQYLFQVLRAADFCHQQNVKIKNKTFSLTPSKNPSIRFLDPIVFVQGPAELVPISSSHCVKGGVRPGQVTSPSQCQ